MFKEFAIILVIFITVFLLMNLMRKRRHGYYQKVILFVLFASGVINLCYNLKYIYPEFVYEGVPIGDIKDNLLVYKEDSEFGWQILFPLIQNRTVYLDDNNNIYTKFMELFADDVQKYEVQDEEKLKTILNDSKSLIKHTMSANFLLDYAFDNYEPKDSLPLPQLYLSTDHLEREEQLIIFIDDLENLYIVPKKYYEEIHLNEK